MKLQEYIEESEKYSDAKRSKKLTAKQAYDLVQKKCKKFFTKMEKMQVPFVYRGRASSDEFTLSDPTKGLLRQSAHTYNYMTLMMDNLPSWKKYPKRSKSLVCSTEFKTATFYGNVYYVIPFDNYKIGICPSTDIWFSFSDPLGGNYVSGFNNRIFTLIDMYGKGKDPSNPTWGGFTSALKEGVKYLLENKKHLDQFLTNASKYQVLHDFFTKEIYKNPDIIQYFNKEFSPEKNAFKNKLENRHTPREVWIEAPCVLIKTSVIRKEGFTDIFKWMME